MFLVTEVPIPILQALASAVGAEVGHGFPSRLQPEGGLQPWWEAKHALLVEIRELSHNMRRNCFSFPLLGRCQPLLPHQHSVGEVVEGPCWELHVSPETEGIVLTVTLEAACEALLRSLHVELSDRLFQIIQAVDKQDTASSVIEADGAWANIIAAELDATVAEMERGQNQEEREEFIASWLTPNAGADGQIAALRLFSGVFRSIGEQEADTFALIRDLLEEPGSDNAVGSAEAQPPRLFSALDETLRRAFRLVYALTLLQGSE